MDDVLLSGNNQREHSDGLGAALKRVKAAKGTLNPSKCEFRKDYLKFLGHLKEKQGVQVELGRTAAL